MTHLRRFSLRVGWIALLLAAAGLAQAPQAQILITTQGKYRLAAPDFVGASDPALGPLRTVFNQVLWNDLYQSGWVTMVGKSVYTMPAPGSDADLNANVLQGWAAPPNSIQRLVFGNMQIAAGGLVANGYLYNTTVPMGPSARMLANRYVDPPSPAGARAIAHKFADAVIAALGGGVGIAESQIAFISSRSGHQEVWTMDYDGTNQQQRTHLGGPIVYSPRISPDGQSLAFMSSQGSSNQIHLLSMLTNREMPFRKFNGLNESPAWAPDGKKLAFASTMAGGTAEIYTINADGSDLKRLTVSHGFDNLSPVWNPKTGAQIAFVSNPAGQSRPQIYTMNADGTNRQRVTPSGYAISPSWSPNGLLLAFAWVRNGGGENDGALDIYIYDLSGPNDPDKYIQLTHNGYANDCPSWAPDGRHLVFESGKPLHKQLFTVLADGSAAAQVTSGSDNEMPNWSWH